VPRWLSGRGLVGAVVYLPVAVFAITGRNDLGTITNIPLALNDIVLAIWLMARGFETARTSHGYAVSEARA
jgi:hypothetical protein